MVEKTTNSSVIINSVDRSLLILEYLFNANEPVALTQISNDMGIYKSTVYRTLATLQNRGYVVQDPVTDKYELGFKVHLLGSRMQEASSLEKLVAPYAQDLADRFGESVNVSKLSVDPYGIYVGIVIAKASGDFALSSTIQLGSVNHCYCSAVGKCLLAFTEGINLHVYDDHPMEAYTDTTITSIKELREELDSVRQNGYAIDNEENEPGLYCVAVPVLKDGEAVCAISLSGPKSRMKSDLDTKVKALKETAARISEEMI